MSSVDERVVRLTFDAKQFEQGTAQTLATISKLQQGLKFEGAQKGFADINAAAQSTKLDSVERGVGAIADKFKTLSIVATAALFNIANQAVETGKRLVSSLTVDPIREGLSEYETNLNSIQTILANTGLEGKAGLNKVTDALTELNHYSDQTIYNFSEMARNIGTFTAAGVSLETSTAAIKGIANLAAASGSNAQQASTAMYQLSQAISAGKVSLEDWNSVVNAGMGGKLFQNSLMETARVHGVAIDKMVKEEGSFRMTLQKGWLTGDILTETLSKFTGDLNAQQLKTMGYNEEQIQGILKMGKTAQDAATKVKTMTQLIDTLQEGAVSGWAQTWQLVFGDFDEAKVMFTDASNVLGGFISASADARNKVISDWKAMGGRTVLIQGISNAFHALIDFVKPIREAFRDFFPAMTGEKLMAFTTAFRDFTEKLKMSGETADKVKRIFSGIFAVLDIGWEVIKAGIRTVLEFFGKLSGGSGKVLDLAANMGDFLVRVREAIIQGDLITRVFDKIGKVLDQPIRLVKALAREIKEFFGGSLDGLSGNKVADSVLGMVAAFKPMGTALDIAGRVWEHFLGIVKAVWAFFEPLAKKFGSFFKGIGEQIAGFFEGGFDYDTILKGIDAGLFAGILLLLKKFISRIGQNDSGLGGLFDGVKEAVEGLTNTLGAMQNTLRAATLLEIAAAIGIITISVLALSKVDPQKLVAATWAITVMFTNLFTAVAVFEKTVGVAGLAKLPLVATGMLIIAAAVDLLAIAVKSLSELGWQELAKGLTGVTVLLGIIVGAMKFMPNPAGLISTGAGLVVLAAAIRVLVMSVQALSGLDWQELAKGLVGVGVLLGSLTLFTKFAGANSGGLLQGAGLVLLAVAIRLLVSAVQDFSQMSWGEIGKGLTVLAGALTAIGAALYFIPPTSVLSAAAVLGVALSLGMIADALKSFGGYSWGEIGKSLTVLAGALTAIGLAISFIPPTSLLSAAAILLVAVSLGMIGDALLGFAKYSWGEIAKSLVMLAASLGIIAGAMILMTEALPGAAALLVVAASLMVLLPVMTAFSEMSWGEIIKSLTMLAGVFVVLGLAGLVLAPLVPVLLGLGAAILILGAGVLLAGAGVLLFATALTALSVAGGAATAAIVAIVAGLIGLIPLVISKFGEMLVALAEAVMTAIPAIVEAIVKILEAIIEAIVRITPQVVDALLKMLLMLVTKLLEYAPKIADTGLKLLTALLEKIRDNIQKVTTVALEIVSRFIDGIAAGLPGLVESGINLILTYIRTLTKAIDDHAEELGAAAGDLAVAIIRGMVNGLNAGIGKVMDAAKNVAKKSLDAALDYLGIHSPSREFHKVGMYSAQGMALGLDDNAYLVENSATDMAKSTLDAMQESLSGLDFSVLAINDPNPVITPVLDLSAVEKRAKDISAMLEPKAFSVTGAYSQAGDILDQIAENRTAALTQPSNVTNIEYVQNNTSPKALSTAEIYRQTHNQISTLKGVLPVS